MRKSGTTVIDMGTVKCRPLLCYRLISPEEKYDGAQGCAWTSEPRECETSSESIDLLISNPASHGYPSPAHATNKAPSQTLTTRPIVCCSVWIVHGYRFCAGKRVLSPSAHARIILCAAHDRRCSHVGVVVVHSLFALR